VAGSKYCCRASMACKAPAVPRAAPRWQRCLSREPVLSTVALLPPDEDYGREDSLQRYVHRTLASTLARGAS